MVREFEPARLVYPSVTHRPGKPDFKEVSELDPFPVQIQNLKPIPIGSNIFRVPPTTIRGITAADALDANDQMGSLLGVAVPPKGVILKAIYHDLDDEGIAKEAWLFSAPVELAANDAAFSLADAAQESLIDVLTFSNFKDAVNCQISVSSDTPVWYVAPKGVLYIAFKTLGADNIAADAMPQISLLIEAAPEG